MNATLPRAGLLHDVAEIAHDMQSARSLIYQLTLRDIRVRYKQATMGFAWAILSPLLLVASGVLVRLAMLHRAGEPFDVSLVTAIVVKGIAWSFFAAAIGFSTTALTGNAPLLTKVYFPRESLPLSIVLASAFDSLIGSATLLVVLPFLGWRPGWAMLWVPLLAALLFLLTLAISLAVSCANLFFRDVKHLVQLLLTFGIFFTPVFFEPALLGARFVPWQMLNPLAPILEGLRLSVVSGHNLLVPIVQATDGAVVWSPLYLLYSAAMVVIGIVATGVIFHRAQFQFAEYV